MNYITCKLCKTAAPTYSDAVGFKGHALISTTSPSSPTPPPDALLRCPGPIPLGLFTARASPKRRCMSRTECLREVDPARTMPRAPLVLARLAWPSRPRSSARWRHEQGCVQMGRYWEAEADHEGPVPCTVPVRAGCGASGRRERATRVGSANGRREWAARAGGASGRCSRVARKRSCADGTVLGRFRTQAPLGLLGGWGMAPRPRLGA